jgi:hypothetical protein
MSQATQWLLNKICYVQSIYKTRVTTRELTRDKAVQIKIFIWTVLYHSGMQRNNWCTVMIQFGQIWRKYTVSIYTTALSTHPIIDQYITTILRGKILDIYLSKCTKIVMKGARNKQWNVSELIHIHLSHTNNLQLCSHAKQKSHIPVSQLIT